MKTLKFQEEIKVAAKPRAHAPGPSVHELPQNKQGPQTAWLLPTTPSFFSHIISPTPIRSPAMTAVITPSTHPIYPINSV